MPRCCACEEDRPTAEFSLRPNGRPVSRCKRCQRAYSKAHYRANKQKHNARRYKRRQAERRALRALLNDLKSVPCADCGEQHPPWAMDFDHLRDKSFTMATAVRKVYSQKRVLEEAKKCEVVCALCHRYRTHGQSRGVSQQQTACFGSTQPGVQVPPPRLSPPCGRFSL